MSPETFGQTAQAGWYPDKSVDAPAGQQRYWNGSAWTERTTAPTTAPNTTPSTAPTAAKPARKPGIILTRWGIPALVGVLAFLFGVGIGAASATTEEPTTAASATTGEPTPAPPTVTVDPSAARQAELDQIAADLDQIAAEQAKVKDELAAKEAELAAREQAVSAAEQEQAEEQEQAVEPEPPVAAPEPANDCHTSYEPCVRVASDVDCEGGSGNGPAYTGRVRVIGPDEYGLDDDGDGVGCEAS